ncbi:bactofilin family protein [Paenibacillus sp. 1P07SE]|uniref:bactofilin family protein n=1 Tax=Paenibacillus sp. 1P07SE TaxID=3132209 RepID=UPI0039A6ECAC
MFKENKRYSSADTLIGQGTVIEGKLTCEGDLRIEGEHRGDLECKGEIIVGECGVARSTLVSRDLTVAGIVYGEVQTTGRLIITASGQIHGSVSTTALIIQEGGQLTGHCTMIKAAAAANSSAGASSRKEESAVAAVKDTKDSKEKARAAG